MSSKQQKGFFSDRNADDGHSACERVRNDEHEHEHEHENENENEHELASLLAYPSHSILNLVTFDAPSGCGGSGRGSDRRYYRIPSVRTTLRTSTLPHPELDPAAGDRIITAVCEVRTWSFHSASSAAASTDAIRVNSTACNDDGLLACAFSDGTVTVWQRLAKSDAAGGSAAGEDVAVSDDDGGDGWVEAVIVGHTTGSTRAATAASAHVAHEEKKADKICAASPTSIADVAGTAFFKGGNALAKAEAIAAADTAENGQDHRMRQKILLLIATASVDGIDLHLRQLLPKHSRSTTRTATTTTQTVKISSHAAASVSMKILGEQGEMLIVSGTASPRGNRIHVYTISLSSLAELMASLSLHPAADGENDLREVLPTPVVKHHGSLPGHLDWITCFDFWDCPAAADGGSGSSSNGDSEKGEVRGGFLLASGGHDARVRLWRFHPPTSANTAAACATAAAANRDDIDNINGSSSGDDEDDEEDDLLEEGEARLRIQHDNGTETAVTLEALLLGHEEAVTSVSFRPNARDDSFPASLLSKGRHSSSFAENGATPCLMTSSMDRTILLWMEENADDEGANGVKGNFVISGGGGGVWVPISRVGAAGGILGGPIGSSLSGFVDATFSPDGNRIAGHGYGGSLHFWSSCGRRGGKEESPEVESERWSAGPCLTGHFRGVSGVSWEISCGQYLLSASLDQTCRLWAEIPSANETGATWHEVGRPQVHGFDLNALACVAEHRLASGADEKVTRIFEAPMSTLRLLRSFTPALSEESLSSIDLERPERAFLPSLGLSNRTAIAGGVEEEHGYEAVTNDDTDNNTASSLQVELPTERDLGVTTLWPESRKLFGHHYEVVCVASTITSTGNVIVASACKARDVQNASIMIFEVQSGKCLQVLKGGHRSTVVSLSFSADGQYLASAGRDRRLCLWRWRSGQQQEDGSNDEAGAKNELFYLASAVDPAHKRIIWSVHFCPSDPCLLASGARDGFAKVWQISRSVEGEDEVRMNEAYK